MSARKAVPTGPLAHLTVEARQTRLSLSPGAVLLRPGGIEFRSATAFTPWTEMTMSIRSPHDDGAIHCSGVVVTCTGSKHAGYHVCMVFTGMSRQAQARLSAMATSLPA